MNKFAVVLGVAAVVTLAGCKDPKYAGGSQPGQNNDVKVADTTPPPPPAKPDTATPAVIVATPAPVEKHCTCAPGTTHTSPCACGASDCRCVVVAKPVAPVPSPEPEYTIYIVQRGDYLAKISKKYNLTIGSIKRLNGLKSDTVRIGQKLKLPGKVDVGVQTAPSRTPVKPTVAKPAKPAETGKAYSGATKEYVVKNGDTLGAIAYGNGITIRQLKQLNGLERDSLKVGQKLKVPAEKQVKTAQVKKPTPVKDEVAKPAPVGQDEAPKTGDETAAKPIDSTTDEVAKPAEPEPAPKVSEEAPAPKLNTYTVAEGDDITSVSIKWGVTAAEIRELNNLPEDAQLKPGQVLKLPAEAQL